MNELIKLFAEYEVGTILIIFILFCLAIKGIVEFIEWVKRKLEDWRKTKNAPEEKEEDMISRISSLEGRVERLERHDTFQYEKLQDIDKKLDDMREENRQQTVAQNRSALMRIYHEVKERGYITEDEYETFNALATNYLACNGNGLFKNHIIPEVERMDVRA